MGTMFYEFYAGNAVKGAYARSKEVILVRVLHASLGPSNSAWISSTYSLNNGVEWSEVDSDFEREGF